MSVNIYTCSQADLESLHNVGPATAARVIALRNEAIQGQRQPVTVEDLADIRLPKEEWQAFIDNGLLSLQLVIIASPQKSTVQGAQAKSPVSQATATIPKVTTPPPVKPPPLFTGLKDPNSFEAQIVESINILGGGIDSLDKKFNTYATSIAEQVQNLTKTLLISTGQTDSLRHSVASLEKDRLEMQNRLASHDIFLKDINKLLPPPGTPVSSMLPSFAGFLPPTPPPLGIPPSVALKTTPIMPKTDIKPDIQQSIIDSVSKLIPPSGIYIPSSKLVTDTKTSVTHSKAVTSITDASQGPIPAVTASAKSSSVGTSTNVDDDDEEETKTRGRSRRRKKRNAGSDSSMSPSPAPPKMEKFSGDTSKLSWNAFISKFKRTASRRGWSEDKKLDRLFDCLTDKALEYADRSTGKNNFRELSRELTLRFDIRDTPVAARQQLHMVKQGDEESLEEFLQRVLIITMDGYKKTDAETVQQIATESFLRGCRHKEAAMTVMNESVFTIQEACKRVKTILANKKAISGGKVSFHERVFTVDEETRVSNIEKSLKEIVKTLQSKTTPTSPARSPSRFEPGGQRQRSPSYNRDLSPGRQNWYNQYRGQSPPRQWSGGGYPPYRGQSPTRQGSGSGYQQGYQQRSPSRVPGQYGYPTPMPGYPYMPYQPMSPQRGYNQAPPWAYKDPAQASPAPNTYQQGYNATQSWPFKDSGQGPPTNQSRQQFRPRSPDTKQTPSKIQRMMVI